MRKYAVTLALLFLRTGVLEAQHDTGTSAPGTLGNAAQGKDTWPPIISLEGGAALLNDEMKSITVTARAQNGIALKPDAAGNVILRGTVEDDRAVVALRINGRNLNLWGERARKKFGVQLRSPQAGKIIRLAFDAVDAAKNKSQKIYQLTGPTADSRMAWLVLKSEADSIAGLSLPILEDGKYWGLVIGVSDYSHPSLKSLVYPVPDAEEVYYTLTQYYNFDPGQAQLLRNPTRTQLIGALSAYAPSGQTPLGKNDNLLVFYAGHGHWDENYREGYWLPSDAEEKNRANWVSNSDIQKTFRAIQAKHILLLSDACFSGSVFDVREAFNIAAEAAYKEPSRKAITAGNFTKVPDRSVFKEFLVKQLRENPNKYLDAGALYNKIKIPVTNNSETRQRPIYGIIQDAGDEGGEFIFVKRY